MKHLYSSDLLYVKAIQHVLILALTLVFTQCQSPKGSNEKINSVIDTSIDSLIRSLYEQGKFNGNILVAKNGKILHESSYGYSNVSNKTPLSINSVFELASVSKQFTAMGIVQLHKQGKVNYTQSIAKYIPELKAYNNVTVEHLLTHRGGLPEYMGLLENWDENQFLTNEGIIDLLVSLEPKPYFEAGTEYKYSNTGYALLASIIERISGKSYDNFLDEYVFKPLEMENSTVYQRRYNPKRVINSTIGHIFSQDHNRLIEPDSVKGLNFVHYLDGINGDGMVNSTLHDLLKWDQVLYGNKFIDQKDRENIFNSYTTSLGKETNYGFGWKILKDPTYKKIVLHSGGWAGYKTYIERHTDTGYLIVMLQNCSTKNSEQPIDEIREIMYKNL